jgi:hypothetical protein
MRVRDQVITAQGVLSLVAIAVMLGYAGYAMQVVPAHSVAAYAEERQTAAANLQEASASAASSAVFTGTIVKQDSGFLLREASGMTYQLDDPSTAQAFAGKSVKVTGKMDRAVKLIHVEKVEEMRA